MCRRLLGFLVAVICMTTWFSTGLLFAADADKIDYSSIPLLRWEGPGEPGTFSQYAAAHPKAPLEITAVQLSRKPPGLVGDTVSRVLVIVNSSLYPSIQERISTYVSDIESHMPYVANLYTASFGTAEQLKAFIKAHEPTVVGCVLVGNLPCAWYEILNDYDSYGYAQWPCDLFLCDLDGQWADNNPFPGLQLGVYDSHGAGTGDEGPEIFLGRIDASRMTGQSEADQTNAYFDKLHAYYEGTMTMPKFGLTYTEDDWASYSDFRNDISHAYPSFQVIAAPATNLSDYATNRLPSPDYGFVQLACHSNSGGHYFTRGGVLHSDTIRGIQPRAQFYNLFCCSASRFTDTDCLGNAYIFNASQTALATVGSTKTGSMLVFHAFYQPFGANQCMGAALRSWFDYLAPYSVYEISWHFGMTVLGDPLVMLVLPVLTNVTPPTFSPPAGDYWLPQNVTITCAPADAVIHYTTDGLDPTESDPIATGPILVDGNMTLKARGWKTGMNPSLVTSAQYHFIILSEAKKAANTSDANVYRAVVTAVPATSRFYVEADDRSCGISVYKSGHGITVGKRVDVHGTSSTSGTGEKYVIATSVTDTGETGSIEPLMLVNRDVGGGDWYYNSTNGAGQKGVKDGPGVYSQALNNIGMLITTTGNVTYSTTGYFYVDDGSKLADNSGRIGIKVQGTVPPPPSPPPGWTPLGKYVKVTGISTCFKAASPSTDLYRQIWATQVVLMQ